MRFARLRSPRRALAAALAMVALAAAGWSVYWHLAAARVEARLAQWPAAGGAWQGSYAAAAVSGFPFWLAVEVERPALAWRQGAVLWRGSRLTVRSRPWAPARFSIDLPPRQQLAFEHGRHELEIAMARGRAEAVLDGGGLRMLAARLERVTVTAAAGPLAVERLAFDAAAAGDALWEAGVLAEGLSAGTLAPPLAARLPHLEAMLRWRGALGGEGGLARRLDAWREAGGIVDVLSLAAAWPPLAVEASGTLALDRQLRPIGAFRAAMTGYDALLDALERSGRLRPGVAVLAAAVLDAMAAPDEDGRRRLAVAVAIQDGMLSVGPFPLLPVPPLLPPEGVRDQAWPASITLRRRSRLRRKRSSSASPSPQRMERCRRARSSLKRCSMSSTASRLWR